MFCVCMKMNECDVGIQRPYNVMYVSEYTGKQTFASHIMSVIFCDDKINEY